MTESGVHAVSDMYKYYVKTHPSTTIVEKKYKQVIYACFKQIVDEILEGKSVKLGQKLGEVAVKKIKRNFKEGKKPRVNWEETMKLKKEGIKKVVYYTDNWYYRFYWKKKSCQVPNKTVYSFVPTKGPNGNRKKLANKIKSDEFSYLIYSEIK